jgi:deazaflavin-dependent oxidoreductase (nitroreductase family)
MGILTAILLYTRRAIRGGDAQALTRIKFLERQLADPLLLQLAGSRPWGVARVEHRGRKSGKLYMTPLWAVPAGNAFLIAMPFGADADWTKNLSAAGEGTLQRHGVRYRVGNPRIVPAGDVLTELPLPIRLVSVAFDIQTFMRVDLPAPLVAKGAAAR